ncbi:MAG TPA: hypothetical protein VHB46_07065 [Burkholderiales bacterium]|nr:hypothetical protein [Burkholderiales bacterium]
MKAVPLKILLGMVLTLLIPAAYAAETGYTYKATDLKDNPFIDATTVATLPEKTNVEILTRQGAWMQIKTPDARQQGWVRMLSVKLGSQDQKPQSSGSLLSALGVGSRSKPATNSTVTTGVRGFSEEDLAKAKPNPAEVEKMKGFSVTKEEAAKLAESGKLAAIPLPYFDENGKPLKEKK